MINPKNRFTYDLCLDTPLFTPPNLTAEQKLWLGVLVDGIFSSIAPNTTLSSAEYWQRKDTEWLNSHSPEIGSFRWICDILDMDYIELKSQVKKLGPELLKIKKASRMLAVR